MELGMDVLGTVPTGKAIEATRKENEMALIVVVILQATTTIVLFMPELVVVVVVGVAVVVVAVVAVVVVVVAVVATNRICRWKIESDSERAAGTNQDRCTYIMSCMYVQVIHTRIILL